LLEFTGERVIPGRVDPDLWNEHRSRYLFAARFCAGKRVLDLGCGTGYGSAELAARAERVVALDGSAEAIEYAARHFALPNLCFVRASASRLPFAPDSFDVVVALELLEHLADWEAALAGVRALAGERGYFIVSTPNKLAYAESRKLAGPNPFHVHEFEFGEFRDALAGLFPHVSIYLQNHTPAITFAPLHPEAPPEIFSERVAAEPADANFFLAVCGPAPIEPAAAFIYLPTVANVLRERGEHIALLEGELRTKDEWLVQLQQELQELTRLHQQLESELRESNRWAASLDESLAAARCEIERLNAELAGQAAGYEAQIASLEEEKRQRTLWAEQTQRRLDEKVEELARCVELLHQTEKTVEERTHWALGLDKQVRDLESRLHWILASRWFRLGRFLGLGPDVLSQ
jgi:SAM-dependent methyltransferase